MLAQAKRARFGLLLAAALVSPALAQLAVPCAAFQRDAIGDWNATEPLTVETGVGLVDVMPGHPVNARVARILNTRCR
jgi:hypothetical protein